MVGRDGQKQLERLIREVSRGERDLRSIRDEALREAVRTALRLHKESPAAPDAYAKARMRARVMAGLRPRKPTLRDNAWTALELLARPAPYIVRGIALASVLLTLGMGAIVASADTLPDDLLYPVKIATEQVRLALADAPGDRAGVELSIAEHRLSEAEKLASSGWTSDALVAAAMFSQHIASAAAELAPQPETDLGVQLESAFDAQRERARTLAATLAVDVKSARGAQVLALIAGPAAVGATRLERIAETAASVAGVLADAADVAAAANANIATPPPSGTAKRSETPPAFVAPRAETPRAGQTQRETPTATTTVAATATAHANASASQSTDRTSGVTPSPATTPTSAAVTEAPTPTSAAVTEAPTPTAAQTHDARAADAAKITRKAADDARAAADKVKQTQKDQHK